MAKKSIAVASVFGLLSGVATAVTGDESAYANGNYQPMKLAAYEGLYEGSKGADIVAIGMLTPGKKLGDGKEPFSFEIAIPNGLSLLAKRDLNAFVPGIKDLVYGNEEQGIIPASEKIAKGKLAIADLAAYKAAGKAGDETAKAEALGRFTENQQYMGFGYMNSPEEIVPPVATTYYSFHYMVYAGTAILLLLFLMLRSTLNDTLVDKKWLQVFGLFSFFGMMIASQFGWVVAEVGRQPWAIQDMLPVKVATTNIAAGHVATTFFIFLVLFTILMIAEVKIMVKQIKIGPEEV
jgi:cytochrome d ubiquinol oxidase subunit I